MTQVIDPISVISTISVALKTVDQFRELVLKFRGKPVTSPSGTVQQSGDHLHVDHGGGAQQDVGPSDLKLDSWDNARYQALQRRTQINWSLLQEYSAQNVALGPEETARMNVRMQQTEGVLCQDFREMVSIFERALGTSLPDHYRLFEVCPG
jgi:hypothetical protein